MIDLGGREFKLLLQPQVLNDKVGLNGAKHFEGLLAEAVSHILGKRRCVGAFAEEERRVIRFWDDAHQRLSSRDFLVRTRKNASDNKRELTLKFRTDDVVLAALAHAMMRGGSHRLVKDGQNDTKFEEDIAPLQIGTKSKKGTGPVVRPKEPKMRSRFSVSCDAELDKEGDLEVTDLIDRIPGFERCYRMATGVLPDRAAKLQRGPKVREVTYGDFKVRLDDKVEAKCCLTVWDISDRQPQRIVEFSYKVPLDRETWSEDAARRALQLFLGLQSSLPTNVEFTSKTEFALP